MDSGFENQEGLKTWPTFGPFSGYRVGSTKSSNPLILTFLWPLSSSFDLPSFSNLLVFFVRGWHLPRSQFDSTYAALHDFSDRLSLVRWVSCRHNLVVFKRKSLSIQRSWVPSEDYSSRGWQYKGSILESRIPWELPIENHPTSGRLALKSAKENSR